MIFKLKIDGKEGTFVTICNEEIDSILLGVVRYSLEIDELTSQIWDEIKSIKEKEAMQGKLLLLV